MLQRAVQNEGKKPAPKPSSSQSFSYVASVKKTKQASISSFVGSVASSSPSKATSTLKSSRTTLLNEKPLRPIPDTEDYPPPSSQPQNQKKRPADSEAGRLSLKKTQCSDPTGGFSGSSQVMDTVYYEEADFDLSDDDEFNTLPSLPTPKPTAPTTPAATLTGSAAILDKAYSEVPVMKRVTKQVSSTETTTTRSASISNYLSTSNATPNQTTPSTSTGPFSAAYSQIGTAASTSTSVTSTSNSKPSILSSPRVSNSISNNDPLPSSQRPLEWSSSPQSHMEPPRQSRMEAPPPRPAGNALRPAPFVPPVQGHTSAPPPKPMQPLKLSSTGQAGPSKSRLLSKPTGTTTGRALPWLMKGKGESTGTTSSTSTPSLGTSRAYATSSRTATTSSTSTPNLGTSRAYATSSRVPKGENAPRSLTPQKRDSPHEPSWDVSLSAVKETQRRIKESSKKAKTAQKEADSWRTPDTLKHVAPVFLSDEQQAVIKLVMEEKSVFFTGSAGTGKSVLMREIISSLRRKYKSEPGRVAVTASTGLAACNIGGVTIHSFAGIGLGKENAEFLIRKVRKNPKAKERWIRTRYLIIDEISMVDGELFDKLEAIARGIRNNGHPFGGIKLVVTGDFFQLPPVPDGGKVARFAFEAEKWNTCINHTVGLTTVFRQRDPEFAQMLNELRIGRPSNDTCSKFRQLNRPVVYSDGLQATELFPTRAEVERANLNKMRALPGQTYNFHSEDGGTITDKVSRDRLLQNCMAPAVTELKKNAQVLLIKNHDETLVNGSLGIVKGFMTERSYELITEQTSELDKVLGWDDSSKMAKKHKKLKALMNGGPNAGDTGRLWPLVEFTVPDGTTRQLLVQPETWKIELPNGEVQASRTQVPLILAWALSIHKAQGQTLERVKVDLTKIFEKGQAYVALSRATTKEGLQVIGFNPNKVQAHEKVRAFYDSLYSAQEALAKPKLSISFHPPSSSTTEKSKLTVERYTLDNGEKQQKVVDLTEEHVKKERAEMFKFRKEEDFFGNEDDFPDENELFGDEDELFGHGG